MATAELSQVFGCSFMGAPRSFLERMRFWDCEVAARTEPALVRPAALSPWQRTPDAENTPCIRGAGRLTRGRLRDKSDRAGAPDGGSAGPESPARERRISGHGPIVYSRPSDNVALFGAGKPLSRPHIWESTTVPATTR